MCYPASRLFVTVLGEPRRCFRADGRVSCDRLGADALGYAQIVESATRLHDRTITVTHLPRQAQDQDPPGTEGTMLLASPGRLRDGALRLLLVFQKALARLELDAADAPCERLCKR